ncbi:MAG: ABC transporter permease [Deltaproteobacteria bacterium]
MREAFVIAKREFLERVRTKWFVAMTVLGPVFMIGMIVIPVLLASRGTAGAKVEIADDTGVLGPKIATAFGAVDWVGTIVPATTPDSELMAHIAKKQTAGFLRVPKDALTGGVLVYRGDNATNQIVQMELRQITNQVIVSQRLTDKLHQSPDQIAALLMPPNLTTLHTNGVSEAENGGAMFALGYILAVLLYFVILLYGINVMRSVVTEKTSRVVELMVAATKPRSMMLGKILGVGGAGLAQISLWLIVGGLALNYHEQLLGLFGASSPGVLPSLSGTAYFIIFTFFVLGFLFYSTLYAAIGAMVASEQDSQQAATPVTIMLVIAMLSMTAITGDPRGHTAAILTLVPFWSPMLMPLRYLLGGAGAADVALSLGILLVSIIVVSRFAAKIYRVGILMYGKRPTMRELLRWLRY